MTQIKAFVNGLFVKLGALYAAHPKTVTIVIAVLGGLVLVKLKP